MSVSKLQEYARSFEAFANDLIIPGVHGAVRFGDVMWPFQRERFKSLASDIEAMVRNEKPPIGRQYWESSKGCSKSSDAACIVLWCLAMCPRRILAQTAASDKDQSAEIRIAASDILDLNPWLSARIKINQWQIVNTATGSTCDILATDSAGSHGARPSLLILDEVVHIPSEDVPSNLMDNAAKVPQSIVLCCSNAGFKGDWAWKWRENARLSPNWAFHRVAEPSPAISPEQIEEAKVRNTESRFLRLYYSTWSAGTGDALDANDVLACVRDDLSPHYMALPEFEYVAGVDIGIKRDASAMVVLGADTYNRRVRLATTRSWTPDKNNEVQLNDVKRAIFDAQQNYNLEAVYYDPHQCEHLAQQLRMDGINMIGVPFTGKNLDTMARSMLEVFRDRSIDLYHDQNLLDQLSALSIVEKSYGYRLQAPRVKTADGKSHHCDSAVAFSIAISYAMELATEGAGGQPFEYIGGYM